MVFLSGINCTEFYRLPDRYFVLHLSVALVSEARCASLVTGGEIDNSFRGLLGGDSSGIFHAPAELKSARNVFSNTCSYNTDV